MTADGSRLTARARTAEAVRYVRVYVALIVATIVTVGVSTLRLEVPWAVTAALAIAAFKVSLVALDFMHLRRERAAIYAALALTLVLAASLMGLILASAADQVGMPIR
jgi:caa(3)-type oxidase subunit IV